MQEMFYYLIPKPLLILCLVVISAASLFPLKAASQATPDLSPNSLQTAALPGVLALVQAGMCEAIVDYAPKNRAIVFSADIGEVFCFTSFDPVPVNTAIYHQWYYRDKLVRQKKLSLKIPRWSTYSSIQLREADKGPWRVEIVDQSNNILYVLRFSITD
jgi:hypothetical protein